jgi:hypothetical protein
VTSQSDGASTASFTFGAVTPQASNSCLGRLPGTGPVARSAVLPKEGHLALGVDETDLLALQALGGALCGVSRGDAGVRGWRRRSGRSSEVDARTVDRMAHRNLSPCAAVGACPRPGPCAV